MDMPSELVHDPIPAWRALGEAVSPGVVRVLLADIDGVVTPGEGHPAEIRVLQRLTETNRQALEDPLVPAVALCTGRQAAYVEVMAQMTGAFLPCIFEHGSGLFFPRAFRYEFHPRLGLTYAENLARVRAALEEPVLRPRKGFVQPGKEASMTLYPLNGTSLPWLASQAQRAADQLDGLFEVAGNVSGIELRPTGIDKAVGVRWMAEEIGVDLERFAGMGDSDPDISFLQIMDTSGAPANAMPNVQAAVGYVAAGQFGDGLLEFLDRLLAANRVAAAASSALA